VDYLQQLIDELKQKIERNEDKLINRTNPVQDAVLKDIVSEDRVTLRGYVHFLDSNSSKIITTSQPQ
jgi:nucleoid DNA-binding protein